MHMKGATHYLRILAEECSFDNSNHTHDTVITELWVFIKPAEKFPAAIITIFLHEYFHATKMKLFL